MENSLLSPGEKLKKLRKKYGLKQYELTGGEVSRNFISMVENGKASLTIRTAEVIARKANKILRKKNMTDIITAYELLESIEEQANKVVEDYLELLEKEDLEDTVLAEIVNFSFNQELTDSIFLLNVKLGDCHFEKKEFSTALLFYMSFFYYTPKDNRGQKALELTLIKTMKLLYLSGDFIKINEAYNSIIKKNKIFSINSKRFVGDVIIKTFKSIGNCRGAIKFIEESLEDKVLIDDRAYKFSLITKLGYCNYKINNYILALQNFDSIYQIKSFREEERQYKVMADIGIALVNFELNGLRKTKEALENINNEIPKIKIDEKNYYYIYMKLACVYVKIGETEQAARSIENYFDLICLDDFEKPFFEFYQVIDDLIRFAKIDPNIHAFKYMKELFVNNSSIVASDQNKEIILKLLNFCLENNLIDEAKEIIKYKK